MVLVIFTTRVKKCKKRKAENKICSFLATCGQTTAFSCPICAVYTSCKLPTSWINAFALAARVAKITKTMLQGCVTEVRVMRFITHL